MPLKKRLLKHPRIQTLLSWFLATVIRLVFLTNRKTRLIDPAAVPYAQGEANAIFAFWHGRMMVLPCFQSSSRPMRVLISRHRDGRLISSIIHQFRQGTITGSSSRGGKAAVVAILKALKGGDNISITPDGPRGPAYIAAPGIATVARLAGKPVLPVTFSATRFIRLKSWDRFMLALPFGRIVFCVGAPIMLDEDDEKARLAIEQALNLLMEKADSHTHA